MNKTSGPTSMETLTGGTNVEVIFANKATDTVFVRQVKMRHLSKYGALLAQSDEAGQIELFTGKDAEWVDNLTPDSFVAVLKEGQRINKDFFVQWAERMMEMGATLEASLPRSKSPSSPQNSPVNAA